MIFFSFSQLYHGIGKHLLTEGYTMEGSMDRNRKCVCGNPMTAVEWKNQRVCYRCGRTKALHEIELVRRVKYAGDIYDALLELGWDADTAASFLNSIPDAE